MRKLLTIIALFWSLAAFGQTALEHYNKGNDKANAKDFAGSIKDYDKAIKLDPKLSEAFYNRASSKLNMHDYKGAIADYDKAIDLNSDYINAYANRGVAKLKVNDTSGALKDFDSAVKLDANNPSPYFMRGQVKLQTKDLEGGCMDLAKAKQLGDSRADKLLKQYCENQSTVASQSKSQESLMLDWPDAEGWRVANQQDNAQETMIELLRNKETFDNWTEIGTMLVYKGVSASKNIPITKTMEIMFEGAKKNCPSSKLTLIEKDETATNPWILFKIECGSAKGTESQVWYAIQGTNDLFVNFRAVKQKTLHSDLQNKWVRFFKTAKIVAQ